MTAKFNLLTFVGVLLFFSLASVGVASDQVFRSGASTEIGIPVDFDVLYNRVNTLYDVVEHDNTHVIWKFTGTTGDKAFVFADGRIAVISNVEFDLGAKDVLETELNYIMDMLNVVGGGVTGEARIRALDSANYYSQDANTYHRIKYEYSSTFDLNLNVPDCDVIMARLKVTGTADCYCLLALDESGQRYHIDGEKVVGCYNPYEGYCSVPPVDISDKISYGVHRIYAGPERLNPEYGQFTMYIEAITTPTSKNFVLYNDQYTIWVEETTKSLGLAALQEMLYGDIAQNELSDSTEQPQHNKTEEINEIPHDILSGTNTISVELSSAEGSKDTGKINDGKVTFYPQTGMGYSVKIDFVDFEGEWCSNHFADNTDSQYFIELWEEGNLLGGVLGANQKKDTWVPLESGDGICGSGIGDRWVRCPDLKNYDLGFDITEPGKYLVQVKVVHKSRTGLYDVFGTEWAKTEYIEYRP